MESWRGVVHLLEHCGSRGIEAFRQFAARGNEIRRTHFRDLRSLSEANCWEICSHLKSTTSNVQSVKRAATDLKLRQMASYHLNHPDMPEERVHPLRRMSLFVCVPVFGPSPKHLYDNTLTFL